MKALLTALALCLSAGPALATGFITSDRGPLRTAYTRAQVTIDGDVARTVVTQVFVSDLDEAVEVTYAFPLPDDAAVTGFSDWRDGRKVDAHVEGKEEARDAYEDATAEGREAALVEATPDARFTMRLSTVPAHGTRRVELQYVQTLSALAGERTFVFPADLRGDTPRPTTFDLDVEVLNDRPIRSLDSLNQADARTTSLGSGHATVHLSRPGGLGRDFFLRWRTETHDLDLAARAVRPAADTAGFVETRFAFNRDPFDRLRPDLDVVVVVDTSLSMAGEPLDRARRLTEGVLAELRPADCFEVITFSSLVTQSFGELQSADDHALMKAFTDLEHLRAGGRSNLAAALNAASEALRDSDHGLLILVSDGQPTVGAGYGLLTMDVPPEDWERHRVLVAHTSYPTRQTSLEALFPQVNLRYLPDGPAGDEAVEQLIRLAVAPVIEELQVTIVGAEVDALHGEVPDRLAVGEHVRLMGRLDADAMVLVTGRLHGQPLMLQQAVEVPDGPDGRGDRGLPVEWARLRVRGLETRLDAGGEGVDLAAVETEIRSLGTAYGLATRYTSYVLTDDLAPDRIKPGDPEIRIHAPETALGVRAMLPWGELVECHWQADEGLWLGRFLVPRSTPDGMYRMRVFVDGQAGTELRGTLFFRVDSKPPELELLIAAPADGGGIIAGRPFKVWARPTDGVYEGDVLTTVRDVVVRDRIDLKRVVLRVGEREIPMEQVGVGELWECQVPGDLPPGTHTLRMVAVDYALNSSEAVLEVAVGDLVAPEPAVAPELEPDVEVVE